MIGAAMSAVLHGGDRRLDELIGDWKALFPTVLAHCAAPKRRNDRKPRLRRGAQQRESVAER
jgi:hypothetical protein